MFELSEEGAKEIAGADEKGKTMRRDCEVKSARERDERIPSGMRE